MITCPSFLKVFVHIFKGKIEHCQIKLISLGSAIQC
jgi:hypothetical protein